MGCIQEISTTQMLLHWSYLPHVMISHRPVLVGEILSVAWSAGGEEGANLYLIQYDTITPSLAERGGKARGVSGRFGRSATELMTRWEKEEVMNRRTSRNQGRRGGRIEGGKWRGIDDAST